MNRRTFVSALAALPLLGACAASSATPQASAPAVNVAIASADLLSPELRAGSARVQTAYRYALANAAALRHIPCYCSCGGVHKSVADCFVRAQHADGGADWDMHGSGCGICQGIVLDSVAMLGQGRPLREVRAAIDAAYRGYGEPTEAEPIQG